MADDVVSLAERRARKQLEQSGSATGPCKGYSVLYDPEAETVALVFDLDDKEATFIVPRDVARRMAKRIYVASEKARRGRAR
jgi:hypothetical protein